MQTERQAAKAGPVPASSPGNTPNTWDSGSLRRPTERTLLEEMGDPFVSYFKG